MPERLQITPQVLSWARESAGLSLQEAAAKLALAPNRLAAIESGEINPTRRQIESFARVFRRPLVAFFLSNPPLAAPPVADFRTTQGEVDENQAFLLRALRRNIDARQSMLREVLEDDEADEVSFVDTVSIDDPITEVATLIRRTIGLSIEQQLGAADREELFGLLRGAIENAQVFVLMIGDLGSYHSAIEPETFRGYAIADNIAPFIVINDNDAKTAHNFTLLHELTHIFVGASGISSDTAFSVGEVSPPVEQFCNSVAAELLMPEGSFRQAWLHTEEVELAGRVEDLSRQWKVSRSAVAYRLFKLDEIPRDDWDALQEQYAEEWRARRERDKAVQRDREGGPSYYVVRRSKLGRGLLSTVNRFVESGALTYTKAGSILGVKPVNVGTLLSS